uniref:DNA polymerase III subunit gamma and tau n=1 Tax=Leucobacter soli TaxID=2812850 RepID=UPI0022A7CE37|nr:DNA polymerase III subunit gamma and tau [Leucobacter soli]
MATALYRRYRPEAFSEMIGQAHVTEPLMTALRTGRIGHAYLFSGPRGCGKTTSARILARCLNCAEGPTDTPCGTCPSCTELSRAGGGSLDVVEIDAASHGGVDDARDLRERAVFAPARDRFKIFIIDEAHMVTAGGFNALLKIVEEPPPHIKFIFATTEPDKVIGTIRSRTHHYPFRLIAPGALIDYVQQLCDSEGVQVEPGVLPLVVRSGGGSVRDTLSILDQLIAGSEGTQVTLERATGLLGYTSTELIDETVVALGSGDAAQAFAATDRVVQTGQDPRRFVEDLLEQLRDLIVIAATSVEGASAVFRGVPADQLQRMFEQSQLFGRGRLSPIADTVSEALDRMTGATAPRLHLELMMARALVGPAQPAQAPAPVQAAPSTTEPPRQPAPAPRVAASAPPPAAGSASAPAPASAPAQAATPVAAPAPASSSAPVDVVAAMKSAREFLNGGASKAPMVPLGGHPPAAKPGGDAPAPQQTAPRDPQHGAQSGHRPESTPGAGSAAETVPAASDAGPAPATQSAGSNADVGESVDFDELRELWPQLLEELLESDREAWNAVRNAQPLGLEGNLLTIGLANRSDLEVFKSAGSGPLREVIAAAIGITVKYLPAPIPAGTLPGGGTHTGGDAGGSPAAADPRDAEPSPAADRAPAAVPADSGRAAPGAAVPVPQPASVPEPVSEPEPEGHASAWGLPPDEPSDSDDDPYGAAPSEGGMRGEFGDPGFDPGRDPGADPSYDPAVGGDGADPAARQGVDPESDESAVTAPEPVPAPAEPAPAVPAPAVRSQPTFAESSADSSERKPSGAPAVAPAPSYASGPAPAESTRYGESVVRELLGARFIEERPLPQSGE